MIDTNAGLALSLLAINQNHTGKEQVMALKVEHLENGVTIIAVDGRLDAFQAKEFKNLVTDLVDDNRNRIIIDMASVDFVDSSGLGSLVGALKLVNNRGGDIKIVSPRPEVRTIFELTRLHRIFDMFDTMDIALKQF